MKNNVIRFNCLLFLSLLVVSCWRNEDDFIPSLSNYKPVIMNRVDFENAVASQAPRNIVKSGKIYIFDNFLFISEVNDGFHVFNYQNPANPFPLVYIGVPGATDLAIRNNMLYINQAIDLIALKFNNLTSTFEFMHRNLNVFPQKMAPDGFFAPVNPNEIIVNWTLN